MRKEKLNKILSGWVQPIIDQEPGLQRLINIATFDLLFGPYTEADFEEGGDLEGYPGYAEATTKIGTFLDAFPHREVWIDLDCEAVFLSEPTGQWTPLEDLDLTEEEAEDRGLEVRDGLVWEEPFLENTYHVGWPTIRRAVLGKDLDSNW